MLAEYQVELVFHLAALLSTRAGFTPLSAHMVNVEGTLNLLEFACTKPSPRQTGDLHMPVVHCGVWSARARDEGGRQGQEDEWTHPTTMYGCNKLYCEMLGHYYSRHYKQLAAESASGRVDFRCVRFPGLISAVTMPSGRTSDYAPEIIHAAARGAYASFVRPDARIPFMAMPDGVDALLQLAAAPCQNLTRTAYNVAAFNPSAEEVRRKW